MPKDDLSPSSLLQLRPKAVVIGAGIGGLSGALRLSSAGFDVTLLERHTHVGGKIRTVPTPAGPADAGPTVLTLRHVFDDLFDLAGLRVEDRLRLVPQPILARHFWPGGTQLDLYSDRDQSARAIEAFSGAEDARAFVRFCEDTQALFDGFDAPMMQAPDPTPLALAGHVMAHPNLIPRMAPMASLARLLRRRFADPRLRQLFGRYATYVGGSPDRSPALLSLIWQAEAAGVCVVEGGMHRLANALAELVKMRGGEIQTNTHVRRIEVQNGQVAAVHTEGGQRLKADIVLFNGDPRALATGALGPAVTGAGLATKTTPRSHSARVYSFGAAVSGPDLAHHNVFFAADPKSEFTDLRAGRLPRDPTLYLCAEDRGQDRDIPPIERFEIIANAPATTRTTHDEQELMQWHQRIMQRMECFGMRFTPTPSPAAITTPEMFAQMFPESQGALYGQSPHGLTAAFKRPTARTDIAGLYLCGGGTHPGAGVPMAALSARHAVAAILNDRTLPSRSVPTAMRGGMSTA